MAVPAYNTAPGTQAGSGAYGAVPGIIGLPPNLYSQTAGQFPGVNQSGTNATQFLGAETAGQIDPTTADYIQRQNAARGIASGMPGSQFSQNNLVESLGLESQNLAHQGVSDYLSFITGQGSQMTNPELAYTVAQQNAIDQAAPNPAAATAALQGQFNTSMMGNRGGVLPISGQSSGIGIVNQYPGTTGDPGNPAILYGPGGGPGQPLYTDMYAGASPYATSPAASTGASAFGNTAGFDPYGMAGIDFSTGGNLYDEYGGGGGDTSGGDYFSGGGAASDMSSLFSDTGA